MTTTTSRYPSPEEIMRTEYKHRQEAIDIVTRWKIDWLAIRKTNEENRQTMLVSLLSQLAEAYGKPLYEVRFTPDAATARYLPETWSIELTNTSIITALHELAHHLKGESETTACRWSIWLFKKTFPKSFDKLTWNGHMLTKNHDNTQKDNIRNSQNGSDTPLERIEKPQLERHSNSPKSKTQG